VPALGCCGVVGVFLPVWSQLRYGERWAGVSGGGFWPWGVLELRRRGMGQCLGVPAGLAFGRAGLTRAWGFGDAAEVRNSQCGDCGENEEGDGNQPRADAP